jgi:hypothetical protein
MPFECAGLYNAIDISYSRCMVSGSEQRIEDIFKYPEKVISMLIRSLNFCAHVGLCV